MLAEAYPRMSRSLIGATNSNVKQRILLKPQLRDLTAYSARILPLTSAF